MILSCLAFASMWVMIRYASRDLHSVEIVFFRNAFGVLALLPMILRNKGLIVPSRWRVHVRRAASGFVATLATFYAVANAPLATVLAINYTAPLFATLGAALVLGERIRARRATALVVGFCGMLVVLRPGQVPLTPGLAAAVVSALSTAFSIVAIRQLVARDDSRAVASWSFLLMLVPSLLVALPFWTWPPPPLWPLLALIGGAAAIGQLSLSKAFSLAEASAVLPYDFVRFVAIAAAGIVLFGERLDALTLVGGAIILATTVYLAWREARIGREEAGLRRLGP